MPRWNLHYPSASCDEGQQAAISVIGVNRVVKDNNPDTHAQRVALPDAQRRLGRADLSVAVVYSTSRPCALCEAAAQRAGVRHMFFAPQP